MKSITNSVWHLDSVTGNYVVESSNLTNNWKDPWGNTLPPMPGEPHYDSESEVTHWTLTVTVNGKRANLVIFND